MIYTKGWRSISLLWTWVQFTFLEDNAPIWAGPEEITTERAREWHQGAKKAVLDNLKQFKVLLPSGELVDADRSLTWGLREDMSLDVDLTVGTIGSGYFYETLGNQEVMSIRLALERRYGILLGCHLLVNGDEAAKVFQEQFPWLAGGLQWDSAAAPRLQAAFNGNEPARREGGRPKKGDGAIEAIVQHEFATRLKGDLAQVGPEAVTNEAIAWIEKISGRKVKVGRTTMRAYLSPLLKDRTTDDAN